MIRLVLVMLHSGRSAERVPLGAGCLASALRSDPRTSGKVEVLILEEDATIDPRKFCDTLLALKPDAAGFSLYAWNRKTASAVARIMGKAEPGIVRIAGGPDAAALDRFAAGGQRQDFDVVIPGEGEEGIILAMTGILEGKELLRLQPAVSRDRLTGFPSSPWLDGTLDPAAYDGCVLWELARGCSYACAYCYESRGARSVRTISDERAEAELSLFVSRGVTQIYVLDPTFNLDAARAKRLLALFRKIAPDIHYHLELRAELVDKAQAALLGSLNCSLQIGLQSVTPAALAAVNRSLEPGKFASRLRLLDEHGVSYGLDLIYALPRDSLEGFKKSLDYALDLSPNNLDVFPLAILPGTELALRAEEYGMDFEPEPPYRVLATPEFPAPDIGRAAVLAGAVETLYNQGRAVGWFGQVCGALELRPSTLLAAWAARSAKPFSRHAPAATGRLKDTFPPRQSRPESAPPNSRGRPQRPGMMAIFDFLQAQFESRGKSHLWPAVSGILRFHEAWALAMTEGLSSTLELAYDPDYLLGPLALDLEVFVARISPSNTAIAVGAGSRGIEVRKIRTSPGMKSSTGGKSSPGKGFRTGSS